MVYMYTHSYDIQFDLVYMYKIKKISFYTKITLNNNNPNTESFNSYILG